jgi:hypothetical protein
MFEAVRFRPRGNAIDFELRRGGTVAPIWQIWT